MIQRTILFLCTGNYYRSRYAEELFNHTAESAELPWRAISRGVAEKGSPNNVGPISPFAKDALFSKGILGVGTAREPKPCLLADFEGVSMVIAVKEAEHRPIIERRFPAVANRIVYWHVDDIYDTDPSIALAMIDCELGKLITSLRNSDSTIADEIQVSANGLALS